MVLKMVPENAHERSWKVMENHFQCSVRTLLYETMSVLKSEYLHLSCITLSIMC